MRQSFAVLLATLSAALPAPAAAGLHQICYRDYSVPQEPLAVTAHCRSDTPSVSCILFAPPELTLLSSAWSAGSRSETYRAPSATAIYRVAFLFSDLTVRTCAVDMGIPHSPSGGVAPDYKPYGSFVGYTTDASGLVMTGVWKHTWTVPVPTWDEAPRIWSQLSVPHDLVVVGGGAVGSGSASGGAFLWDLEDSGWGNLWESGSREIRTSHPYVHEGHAIAMKIEGLSHAQLLAVTGEIEVDSASAAHPTTTVTLPLGHVALGGSASAGASQSDRQFLTETAPTVRLGILCPVKGWWCQPVYTVDGWKASSKDHVVSSPGRVTSRLRVFPAQLTIGQRRYLVESSVDWSTSAPAPYPSAVVAGRQGEYALTGVGASVDWRTHGWAGNLLWQVIPRPDLAGAEAASKDHTISSPATITVYAVGIKLVPLPP